MRETKFVSMRFLAPDLENLLRGLTHGGGVEVVMSMDEMPGGFIPGTPIDGDFNEHGGMYRTI